MDKSSLIYVAGHQGMVGSAIVRRLEELGYHRLLTASRRELDLTDQAAVRRFVASHRPEYLFLAAAKVGGIHANNRYRADFITQNLLIQTNLIEAAWRAGVERLMFLGSSCIYPARAPQPMREEYLLTGPLEPTNEPYAIAKIAGLKMCEAYNHQHGARYAAVMPTNLYGPNDYFDLERSHVLPALMLRFHAAKLSGAPTVTVWGSGTPRREFLHVDDLAAACVMLMERDHTGLINIGSGQEYTIRAIAELMAEVVGFTGTIEFDSSRPDGVLRKLVDCSQLNALGWHCAIPLRTGLEMTYRWFLEHQEGLRR